MSEITLFIGIIVFIILLIICIHAYDRYLVKEIKIYENRLESKGIFKRHFIKTESKNNKIFVECKNCSNKFVIKGIDIPPSGRLVKCSHCSSTWRHMPSIKQ